MSRFASALRCELLKARRSRVLVLTVLGFSLAPIMAGLFMFILEDPARARTMGLIGAKAQLTAGVADWPTYVAVIAQAVAVGGSLLFAFVTAWVFGREFADRTVKLTLALPTSRASIVTAKFAVVAAWCSLLSAWVFGLSLAIGLFLGMPGWSAGVVAAGAGNVAGAAGLTMALVTPTAFFACAGRGYLAPLGFTILMIFLAQVLAAIGWGAWFPWSVPALFAGLAGPRAGSPGDYSVLIVAATSAAGLLATFGWWALADQTT